MAAITAFARSRSAWSRLLSLRSLSPRFPLSPTHLKPPSSPPRLNHRHFSADASTRQPDDSKPQPEVDRVARALIAEMKREERREAIAAGIEVEEEEEDEEEGNEEEGNVEEEDYSGVKPSMEELETEVDEDDDGGPPESPEFWEPTDSESDEDDERYCIVTRLYLYGGRGLFLFAFDAPIYLFCLALFSFLEHVQLNLWLTLVLIGQLAACTYWFVVTPDRTSKQ